MARPHSVHLGERIIAAVADGKSSTRAVRPTSGLMTAHLSGRCWRTLTFGPCATTDEAPITPRHHGTGSQKLRTLCVWRRTNGRKQPGEAWALR